MSEFSSCRVIFPLITEWNWFWVPKKVPLSFQISVGNFNDCSSIWDVKDSICIFLILCQKLFDFKNDFLQSFTCWIKVFCYICVYMYIYTHIYKYFYHLHFKNLLYGDFWWAEVYDFVFIQEVQLQQHLLKSIFLPSSSQLLWNLCQKSTYFICIHSFRDLMFSVVDLFTYTFTNVTLS